MTVLFRVNPKFLLAWWCVKWSKTACHNAHASPPLLQVFGTSTGPVVVVVVYGKLAFSSSYAVQKRPFFCSTSRPTQFNSSSCEAINGLMENGLVHTIYYQQYQGVMQSIQIMFNHNNFNSDLKSD